MAKEIREAGAELMVSVWPTVNPDSVNFPEMERRNLLLRARAGNNAFHTFTDTDTDSFRALHYYDPFNPEARRFVWDKVRRNYADKGIRVFWLDPLNLCRSAWAGSQRFGAAVWSGDAVGTFESLRLQIAAGLSFALCGIPWWTTDIGGFFASPTDSPEYHELLVRWFQFGVFSPICRLHGYRDPVDWKTGGPNEVWSFGEDVYVILKDLLFLRERLRPYVERNMAIASETGLTFLRPLFVDFPHDKETYDLTDQYMLGEDLMVAPVVEMGQRERLVYLPAGYDLVHTLTGERYRTDEDSAGKLVAVPAPLNSIPVFVRWGSPMMDILAEPVSPSSPVSTARD